MNTPIRRGKSGLSDLAYIVDGSLATDLTSDPIACIGYDRLIIEVTVQPSNDPVADLYLQASGGGSLWGTAAVEKLITSDEAAITLANGVVTINDPAAAAMLLLIITNPAPNMRLFFDRTAGGAEQIDAAYWLEPLG